jgi:hypothetical protein
MLDDEKANEISELWGRDAVHPLQATYETMASVMDSDITDEEARYINPPKQSTCPPNKKPRIDQSKLRQDWVDGCSGALPRRDTFTSQCNPRGFSSRGRGRGSGRGSSRHHFWSKAGCASSGGEAGGGGARAERDVGPKNSPSDQPPAPYWPPAP